MIVTRFAPSPTGALHIGSARTALFNYLYAKHFGGKFLLRIEDTDKARSTQENVNIILDSMSWLGLEWDDLVFQTKRIKKHQKVVEELIKSGNAYYCYSSQEEINQLREDALSEGQSFIFTSPWRENNKAPLDNAKPVVRLKIDRNKTTILNDLVQGEIKTDNKVIDDVVLLRSDGTPTYMLAVVVDDHDMGVTHIIRGDDHLTNCFKQMQIYMAMDWQLPKFCHIPLIHGSDGGKLSKRHGAAGMNWYQEQGFLPSALNNYLLRLGWSHGNDEIITKEEAIKWFNTENIGKAPAKMDMTKLEFLNNHYIKALSDDNILSLLKEKLPNNLTIKSQGNIAAAIGNLKERVKDLNELTQKLMIYTENNNINFAPETKEILLSTDKVLIDEIVTTIQNLSSKDLSSEEVQNSLKLIAKNHQMKLGELMQPIRILMTGTNAWPSIFNMIAIIGTKEAVQRIKKFYTFK